MALSTNRKHNVLRCPECDEDLEGNLGRVPAAVDGDAVRVAIDCPGCATSLEFSGVQVGISIEAVGGG
ncbi:hypothetical protein [Natrinema halophilum]|uniref:Uncharacterized protein n=1 Tax=Natrinema halophilum TaxID=1699371 RepID=A0A7D5GHM9_9EURY|nr:hypothetical protein [Natrinema halophilum]QLG49107.1 hypothetical protein HYG82_09715 [Natrinema halophilum]